MTIQNSLSPMVRSHRPLRTVLIGTSLGAESDQVVRAGLSVAHAAGARVYLVHAVELDPLLPGLEHPQKAPCSVLVISPDAALAEGIAEAVDTQTSPAWHQEPERYLPLVEERHRQPA